MSVSVIIPTRNRAEILGKTLQAYAKQCGDHGLLEIFVVDDGSTDQTAHMVEGLRESFPVSLRYIRQEHRGISAARNHGIREAAGELILFGDDDILPSRSMVAEHVAWHRRNPGENEGVLGSVAWASEMHPTPFMEWSGLYGPQFNFGRFQPGGEIGVWDSYFCNTSVKLSFLRQNGMFDEQINEYGWEDLELSYRLRQKGYRVWYSQEAYGYHYKYETFQASLNRVLALNRSLPSFARTEAGKCFIKERAGLVDPPPQKKPMGRRLLRPIKRSVLLVLRLLFDTQIPFPPRLYEYVFYDYVSRNLSSG